MDETLVSSAYCDPTRSAAERADDLLALMTLDEKLAQLAGVPPQDVMDGDALSDERAGVKLRDGIGHISRIGGSTLLHPAESAQVANAIQGRLVDHTRLGIPAILHEESCAGYTARGATCFPQAIGLASTWSPDLIEEMTSTVIRRQMRAVGAHQSLAPVLDIARDPRWGRTEETYGEDPYLASRIGVAYVRGLQGDDLREGVAATAKHFIGYGASEGGLNWAPAHIGPRELLEIYARPFEAAIREAGLASVMNAYHELDGVPCGASADVLDALLRQTLGFDGVVVSDYFTVPMLRVYHHIAESKEEAAARALEAGLDVELPAASYFGQPLHNAVTSGRISMAQIDRAVLRVLRMKFALGLFEEPYVDVAAVEDVFDTPEQRALARRIAQQSIVLLKNDDAMLPLGRDLARIAIIGPSADSVRLLQGDYHYPAHMEIIYGAIVEGGGDVADAPAGALAGVTPGFAGQRRNLIDCFVPMVTLLEGIRGHVSPETEVLYAKGCEILGPSTSGFAEAIAAAGQAEVAIVCVGGRSGLVDGSTSGESSDRADLGLPGVQQQLVEAIVATGTPTVVVLINGQPLALPWIAEHVPALVEAWLPGEEGGNAVADVLFGDVNPAGRLPVSLARDVGQLPVFYNHKPSGGRSQWRTNYVDLPVTPLFAFGHGLSYTRFVYGELAVEPVHPAADDSVEVRIDVTNAGERPGDEVVQLYLHDVSASVTRPVKQLAGFARIPLDPGEKRTLVFDLSLTQLAFHDRTMQLVIEPGEVEVLVGASSSDIRASARFSISGERRVVGRDELTPTRVRTE